ncbi:protoheme IX farnesyltransferase [Fomitiporia mediterranea MF3/22]|uniref:protoheme IX farnesyltransferase n=1 Tax=Fomitiporia mediterranea (strain MF3/22) TaxID=694068 RepID=UPI0004407B8B|nr:protoheme IX farnesyltransferase [Fomitiporia mediterranea MF3/22]EJD06486.1 protoheme IX farnesyltransferase [Fomitiporia mediterranea MF3/22]
MPPPLFDDAERRRANTSVQGGCEDARHPLEHSPATTASAAFTSYFWRNDQWAAGVHRRRLLHPPLAPRRDVVAQATAAFAPAALPPETSTLKDVELETNYPPSPSVVPYRPIPRLTLPRLITCYSQLSKDRLTVLIVLTAMSSVALSPLPTTVPVLLATALGTALCSASANTLNQIQEVPFDAQMTRTRNRPLVRRAMSTLHATAFAFVTGVAGPSLLWVCVNPTTALLGVANIALYAGAYTYLKRRSISNTWVGAVVGGIPPVMGWTACGGHLLPSVDYPIHMFLPFTSAAASLPPALADNPLAPIALFMFLYSWQFPHFNSLSYFVRESYARAGYRMLSVISPVRNAAVALRHALLLVPICSVLFPLSGLVGWGFALTSLVPNVICVRHAYAFWRVGGNSEKAARKLFYTCLWYLPVVMALMMVHKNGLDWTGWLKKEDSDEKKEESSREM